MKDVMVIGSGGFSKQVIEMIENLNILNFEYNLIGVIDDNKRLLGTRVLGYKVIGDLEYIKEYSSKNEVHAIIAIADEKIRKKISLELSDVKWMNLVHPSAVVSKYSNMGEGNIICAGVIINPNFEIGNHCHINIGSTLGHDILIKNYVTIMPGCRISGNVNIDSESMVGTGAIIVQGVNIEDNVRVGAGALILKDLVRNNLYVGVPAEIKHKYSLV